MAKRICAWSLIQIMLFGSIMAQTVCLMPPAFYDSDKPGIFEQMHGFSGREKSPLEFLATTTVYPTFTQNNCPEWKMYVKFAIMADGSIDHVNVVRGFYPSCAVRSVRVNSFLLSQITGMNEGYAVSVWYTIPYCFKLHEKSIPKESKEDQE